MTSLQFVRDANDPYVWAATFRFPSTGRWVVKIVGNAPIGLRVARPGALGTWAQLERPFHIPTIAPGTACPTSGRDPKGDLSRLGFNGPAWGLGPAYPGIFSPDQGKPVLYYEDPIPPESLLYGSKWFGQKVLWVVDRQTNRGPILIRGRQVDGMNRVRFDLARDPVPEMTISPLANNRPSTTRVRAHGCYAYQVDGKNFSSVIVLEARPYPR